MRDASGERRQFRTLVRLFAYRFFDTDILSIRGDISSLLSQFAALMMALSFIIALKTVMKYWLAYSELPAARVATLAWADQEFLISTTMAVAGIVTLLVWDALFPDRRDSLILGAMPVRIRTIFVAKIAALAVALLLSAGAVNSFTGLFYPFAIFDRAAGIIGAVRSLAAYWVAMILAAAFVFLALISVQGLAIHALPHRLFLRASSVIQAAAFFAVLMLYFLMPPLASPAALHNPGNAAWYAVLAPYWFLGLFQVMRGSAEPAFGALAERALAGLGVVLVLAAVAYALAYARHIRRLVEQPGIIRARRTVPSPWARLAARGLSRRPLEGAILAFVIRTLARSRQHRMIMALYAGMGLTYVFSQIAAALYRPLAFGAALEREKTELGIPLILMFFVILGLRVCFSIPVELRANWLFRLTDPFASGAYLGAARKTLIAFGVAPALFVSAVAYAAVWPASRALGHVVFLMACGLLVIELSLARFAKVPFTCSYLPGSANLKLMFGVYWALLMAVSELATSFEREALKSPSAYAKLMLVLSIAWLWAHRRARGARKRVAALTFEERPEPAVMQLGIAGGE
jgi:hypothetical protein